MQLYQSETIQKPHPTPPWPKKKEKKKNIFSRIYCVVVVVVSFPIGRYPEKITHP
jgi:hypothetical protein